MDHKEFIEKLQELAELEVVKEPSPAKRKLEDVIAVWRNGSEHIIEDKENPTLAYKIKKIKYESVKCSDCNKKIKNRVVTTKRLTYPIIHWRNHCNNCNKAQDPRTGEYHLVGGAVQTVWNGWLKEVANESKAQELPISHCVQKKPTK